MSRNEYRLTNGDVAVTDQMLADFQRDGYVVIRGLLDEEEVGQVFRVLETSDMTSHEYGRPDKQGKQSRLILWQHPGSDVTGMVARSEKIVNTCEKLLGGEVYHYHSKLNSKEPNIGGKFEWHQDYGYWYKYGCLFPDMMTTFIALTRCDNTNGCMQVLRGSHKCGRIEHTIVGDQTGADLERVRLIEEKCERIIVELNPGDGLLFHSNVLHTSSENTSDTWRRALLVAYNRASNSPVDGGVKHPGYTPLHKVPNTAIRECANYTDFSGKIFYNPTPQI